MRHKKLERLGWSLGKHLMHVRNTSAMLHFRYIKSSSDIIDKAKIKVEALKDKIEERKKRIAKTREEYGVDDAMMIDLLQQARNQLGRAAAAGQTYMVSKNSSTGSQMTEETIILGAGVVNMLFTEQSFIEGEKTEVARLELIIRNLVDVPNEKGELRGHDLDEEEIRYLGF